MSLNYYVVKKEDKNVYILAKNVLEIPFNFTIDNEEFSLNDVKIETPKLDFIGPIIALGFIFLFITGKPLGLLIGTIIGIFIVIYDYIRSENCFKSEKEKLKIRIKNRK